MGTRDALRAGGETESVDEPKDTQRGAKGVDDTDSRYLPPYLPSVLGAFLQETGVVASLGT